LRGAVCHEHGVGAHPREDWLPTRRATAPERDQGRPRARSIHVRDTSRRRRAIDAETACRISVWWLVRRTPQKPDDEHQNGNDGHNCPDDEERQERPPRITRQAV